MSGGYHSGRAYPDDFRRRVVRNYLAYLREDGHEDANRYLKSVGISTSTGRQWALEAGHELPKFGGTTRSRRP